MHITLIKVLILFYVVALSEYTPFILKLRLQPMPQVRELEDAALKRSSGERALTLQNARLKARSAG